MIVADMTNRDLRMLWKEVIDSGTWPDELPRLWPLQHPACIETPTLVFVGMNAAYALRDAHVTHERPMEDCESDLLLDPDGRSKLCDQTECPPAPYFRPFDRFTENTGLPRWTHLDIFAVKHTDQGLVKHALGLDDVWTDFANRQFLIFKDLLERIAPPIIVVPNVYASRILHKRLGAGEMSPEYGCHFVNLNGRQIPAFFSGMLSGQRAMDIYSRERLVHQVRKMIATTLGHRT